MLTYDPRTISSKVYKNLDDLKNKTPNESDRKEQKSQAVELYTYISTWGLLRLKAEEFALSQDNKRRVVQSLFQTLGEIAFSGQPNPFLGRDGLNYLTGKDASEYLGFTGLALQVAREFAFWAEAIYPKTQTNPNPPTVTN
ncbi:hypothetical protein QUA40_01805 [Microcoleus sp. Pol11C3]|uniref:hypothetical protein n=1 Tax=Microcoleus sp. Pol11C3 TaxID=3055390 RepID=UPI002FD02AA1